MKKVKSYIIFIYTYNLGQIITRLPIKLEDKFRSANIWNCAALSINWFSIHLNSDP